MIIGIRLFQIECNLFYNVKYFDIVKYERVFTYINKIIGRFC